MLQKSKKEIANRGIKQGFLAGKCGWSPANFSAKLVKDNMTEKMKTIADALDCDLVIEFRPKNLNLTIIDEV